MSRTQDSCVLCGVRIGPGDFPWLNEFRASEDPEQNCQLVDTDFNSTQFTQTKPPGTMLNFLAWVCEPLHLICLPEIQLHATMILISTLHH